MSVFFRLHQDKSVGTKRSGKWYARMVPMGVIDTRRLAEIVQRNCTVKERLSTSIFFFLLMIYNFR